MALSSMSLAVMVKAIWLQLIMPLHMDKLTITGERDLSSHSGSTLGRLQAARYSVRPIGI